MLVDKTSFALGLPPKYKSTPNWETISSQIWLCSRGHYHAETGNYFLKIYQQMFQHLRFFFIGTKQPSLDIDKQPQNPGVCTQRVYYTWKSTRTSVPLHPTQTLTYGDFPKYLLSSNVSSKHIGLGFFLRMSADALHTRLDKNISKQLLIYLPRVKSYCAE